MDKDCKDTFYLYLHQRIGKAAFEKFPKDGTMSLAEVRSLMFQWKIPESLKPVIIKIWENMGVIEKIDRRNILFKKVDFDVDDIGGIYETLGLFQNKE